jgi:hypothetical protein
VTRFWYTLKNLDPSCGYQMESYWWPPDGRIFGGHEVEKSSGEGCEGI